jgi:hypothetical protein
VESTDEVKSLSPKITLGRYVYEDIYPAFKAATNEKQITARINCTFLNYLAADDLVLSGSHPAVVADIGCGPCDTLIRYLTGVSFPPGFLVRATDFIPKYADSERGEAVKTLMTAQMEQVIKLVTFETRAGDAFASNLLDLLSASKDRQTMRQAFNIVFVSHVIYHADAYSDVQRMLTDVADNLLARDGLCILYHIANTPRTFQDFRARFGGSAGIVAHSDTGAVTIDDPPAQIRVACDGQRLPLYEASFKTTLSFGPVRDDEWRAFADPSAYDRLAVANPAAYEDLKRLYFVVQRAPLDFAADYSPSGLNCFVSEIREVIESNNGVLPLAERIQVFTRRDANPVLANTIPEALAVSVTSAPDDLRANT